VMAPANAIFFGAVLYEFARELNHFACSKLTQKEFVEMAFFYSCIVETHSGRTLRMHDTEGRIRNYLSERYLFGGATSVKHMPSLLKDVVRGELGGKTFESTLWKVAHSRHNELVKYERENLPPNPANRPTKERKPRATSISRKRRRA
jgi:hypothetical protein